MILHDDVGNPIDAFINTGNQRGAVPFIPADGLVDAFSRMRVSQPFTLFDSKQTYDNQPLLWDDSQTSGSGTTSTHSVMSASTTMSVSNATAGIRVRQTFRRFNYQPGKSQLIYMTFGEFDTTSGLTKRVGIFDQNDGLFFQSKDGTLSVVKRSGVSTDPSTDTVITQANWNLDKLDGTGLSGITLDPTKVQIGIIDFEWLGVGTVRMGFIIGEKIIYCHAFHHANLVTAVYMSTPVLPLRYEIANSGSGSADSFVQICSTVISEGGQERTGVVRHKHSLSKSGLLNGTEYAMLGIRLKPGSRASGEVLSMSMTSSTTNDQGHWMFVLNPTVAGNFTYINQDNSIVQIATGTSANTVTGGTDLDGGFFQTTASTTQLTKNLVRLGFYINGTPTEIALTIIPLSNNITVSANIEWIEY